MKPRSRPKTTRFFIGCPDCGKTFDLMKAKHGWRIAPPGTSPRPLAHRRTPYVQCSHCRHVF